MKQFKYKYSHIFVFLLILLHTACAYAADSSAPGKLQFSNTAAYMITTLIACVLLFGYCLLIRKKEPVFLLLFISVFIINFGYAVLSRSQTLDGALLANKITYCGAVFLPLFMLLIIVDECGLVIPRHFIAGLLFINAAVLTLALSPGHSTLYYSDVTLGTINGSTVLEKTYGPLHWIYLAFLLFYFGLMFAAIAAASRKRPRTPSKLASLLLLAVLLNILVWFIEQKIDLEFEFLSISYIVTELYLLSLYNMKDSFADKSEFFFTPPVLPADSLPEEPVLPSMEVILENWPAVTSLTPREMEVFSELIVNKKRKDIAEQLCVSENTIKKHTSNIFDKLEVSTRSDIMDKLSEIK